MSDSEDSTVTYTEVSSPFEDLSDIGSPGVIVHGYDGLPMMLEDPYAYVEAAMQEPPPPDYVPEPVYPEFMPPEDDVLPAEEQPLPAAVSPTAESPGYITESDLEEDPEEDDEDPEEDPTDYPTDRDDDDEEESSGDDADDEEEDEGEDEEEEEHLALADSILPPPLPSVYRTTARMSIRAQIPTPLPSEVEVDRLLALPTPPPSPLTPLSSPLPQISSLPLLVSPPLPISPSPLPASPTHLLGYRAAMIQREPNFVMSDSEDYTVTYTEVSSEFEDLSDIGSPRVIVHGYDGLPMKKEDPYAYPKDDVLPAEEQPLPAAVSPTADSPGYLIESDPEEDPKEEDDEDPEEDPANFPTDRDDDDDEEESFEDDADDKEEDEGEDEEEEHLALADSIPPPPPLPVYHTTARMSIRAKIPTPLPSKAEVDRLLDLPTPPPSPLTPLSSSLPQIPSLPLPVSPPLPILPSPLPASPTHSLGYRAAMIRAIAPSTYCLAPRSRTPPSETPPSGTPLLLPIPLPTSSPPLLLPSTDCRADVLEVTLPPQKRLCIALGPRYEIVESSSTPTTRPTRGFRADYGFVSTLDAKIRHDPDSEIGYGITDDDRSVMSGQLNLLRRDRRSHARTTRLMESEARLSRQTWRRSMDASDIARSEVMALRTTSTAD
ncbi:hypothetical protein Tco_1225536 [Tanacetum coccineum]